MQEFPERYYLYGHVTDGSEKSLYRKTSELIAEFKNSGMRSDYDVAYIQYEDNVAKANFTEYDNTILLMDERPLKGKIYCCLSCRPLDKYRTGLLAVASI